MNTQPMSIKNTNDYYAHQRRTSFWTNQDGSVVIVRPEFNWRIVTAFFDDGGRQLNVHYRAKKREQSAKNPCEKRETDGVSVTCDHWQSSNQVINFLFSDSIVSLLFLLWRSIVVLLLILHLWRQEFRPLAGLENLEIACLRIIDFLVSSTTNSTLLLSHMHIRSGLCKVSFITNLLVNI